MPVTRLLRAGAIALLATALLATSSAANQRLTPADVGAWDAPLMSPGEDSWVPQSVDARSAFSRWGASKAESAGSVASLPPASHNIELVGELQMDTPDAYKFNPATGQPDPSQPDVMPGQIADLAVYKNIAYLNSWSDASCRRGGIFVVDISNPARPQQLSFLPAEPNTRHGEGAIVQTLQTPSGPMDVLAVNNEPMPAPCSQTPRHAGGFDLWNVTNPRNPQPLKVNVGDTGDDDGSLVGADPVHQSHSTTMWTDDRGRTFVAATDNTEFHDLDIFEITNDPANPRPVAEFDILDRFPQVYDNSANGDWVYNHDMSVRKINGTWTLLLDYWDAGYVTLDVDNPADPQYLGDTSFDGPDPLMPRWNPPEGNAHQGEFSHDGKYILAADEDFDTYRLVSEIDGEEVAFSFGIPVTTTTPTQIRTDLLPSPGDPIEGDTRFIGEACSAASVPAPQAGETVAIAARGTCDFEDKAMFAEQAGYEAVLIMQNGVGAAPRCEATNLNMQTDSLPVPVTIKMLLIGRAVGFQMLGLYDEATYACDPANPTANTPNPPDGTAGLPVRLAFEFDGWGYTHLFQNGKGKLPRVDSYAVPEGLDERFATGFGDLTVHEFATDPTEYLAYSSYYAAGMRVFRFGADGLTEVGKYIPQRGANFWGVEQFTQNGVRYFAGSDRDYGLYILRYTGPGAAQRPVCTDSTARVPYKGTATVQLPCSDANGNPLKRSVVAGPSAGSVSGNPDSGTVTYRHTGNRLGADRFTFKAADGTLESTPATAQLTIVPAPGRCLNPFAGTARADRLAGSRYGDRIRGNGGRDRIWGRGGRDCLYGQDGRDRVYGDDGDDRIYGGADRDLLYGGGDDDRMWGGSGNDHLRGGPGTDRLFGHAGVDRIEAGSGRRHLLSGGAGNDRLMAVNGRRDTLRCGRGRDRVRADANDRVARDCEVVRKP